MNTKLHAIVSTAADIINIPSLQATSHETLPAGRSAIIHNTDCIRGMHEHLPDNSVDLTVTSIPFEELFTYSGKIEDVGNNGSTIDIREGRFALNLRFVIAQLFRVTKPGCLCCIHIQQLLAYKNQHGFSGRRDFRGAVVDLFRSAGGFVREPDLNLHEIVLDTYDAAFNAAVATAARLDPAEARSLADRVATDIVENISKLAKLGTAAAAGLDGFRFVGDFAIPKDPQAMAQRLNLMSLQFKSGHSRSSNLWSPAPNDYVLIFQKPGEEAGAVRPLVYKPGAKPMRREEFYADQGMKDPLAYAGYLRDWAVSSKAINPDGWMSADDWILWARGVWEIDEFDVIDGARSARESTEEKHVCPLQLEVIRRLVLMYTNPRSIQPDVTVLDPFMGVGSTAAVCVELDRNSVGFELKESYHANALLNVERARTRGTAVDGERPGQMTLADLLMPATVKTETAKVA